MGVAPDIALRGTLFSTGVRPLDADPMGVPVLLLVSIHVGDRRLGAAGDCLSEGQELKVERAGRVVSMLPCRCQEKV